MAFSRAPKSPTAGLAGCRPRKTRYAVFGGAALNFHGIARFTEDVDLFIAPELAS
jgi:Nucleotidyl transferase AbiEii toxin, Type IV TA system